MKQVTLLVTIETHDDIVETYDILISSPIKNSIHKNRATAHVMDVRILKDDMAKWLKKELSNDAMAA